MPDELPTNWRKAELARLAYEIKTICDFVDHWGRRPTAEELRELLPKVTP